MSEKQKQAAIIIVTIIVAILLLLFFRNKGSNDPIVQAAADTAIPVIGGTNLYVPAYEGGFSIPSLTIPPRSGITWPTFQGDQTQPWNGGYSGLTPCCCNG